MKPRVYFAGKIGKNDWRHDLVPGLRGHEWKDGPIVTNSFDYIGPFFVASNHGGNHGPNRHGAVGDEFSFNQNYDQQDVIDNNNASLDSADMVFAYITANDCYGTLIEVGWALAKHMRVALLFAPGIPVEDYWYCAMQSAAVHTNVHECCLPRLLASELQKTNPSAANAGAI